MGSSPSLNKVEPLIKLLAQRTLHHLGAAIGAGLPYLIAGTTGTPWPVAIATSSVVVVAWLLGNAHLQGRVAEAVGTKLVAGLHELLSGEGLGTLLGQLLPSILGQMGGQAAGPVPTRMPPPPGFEHVVPGANPPGV